MAKVHWTLTARRDLKSITEYIAQDSHFYAVEFVERIFGCVEVLEKYPKLGRVVPEFQESNIREVIFHNYRIVYLIKQTKIYVVSVCHGAVDILSKSKKEKWIVK